MRKKLLVNTMLVAMVMGAVMTGCGNSKTSDKTETKTATEGEMKTESSEDTTDEKGDADGMKNEVAVDEEQVKEIYENAKNVSIEKVIRTVTEDEDGNSETVYDTYILSEVDFEKGAVFTEDYAGTIGANEEFLEENVEVLCFDDVFGTTADGIDGWELFEKILVNNGIEFKFDDVTFDKEINEITGQNIYVFNGENEVINGLLSGEEYDEVTASKVCYQTRENENKVAVPDTFTAEVQFKKGTKTVTRNLFIQVYVNE